MLIQPMCVTGHFPGENGSDSPSNAQESCAHMMTSVSLAKTEEEQHCNLLNLLKVLSKNGLVFNIENARSSASKLPFIAPYLALREKKTNSEKNSMSHKDGLTTKCPMATILFWQDHLYAALHHHSHYVTLLWELKHFQKQHQYSLLEAKVCTQ